MDCEKHNKKALIGLGYIFFAIFIVAIAEIDYFERFKFEYFDFILWLLSVVLLLTSLKFLLPLAGCLEEYFEKYGK